MTARVEKLRLELERFETALWDAKLPMICLFQRVSVNLHLCNRAQETHGNNANGKEADYPRQRCA
jgi:hypothetical protein